ncbi:MAG TPA: serine/threonine-protein kinase, partial [Urbifossiella sp.]|nr:serine/threonine-protein kinase [Urbifossiella sp.]
MPPDATAEYHPSQLGAYDVVSKIAEGGMGTVYKGRDRRTGEVVAIKVISPGTNRNPTVLLRFEREFTAARVLEHPNVVRAIEYCGTGPHPFLVMEFVDGESVGQLVERAGPVPEDDAVRLIGQVCDGLQRAHKQGLIHRDVKPDNILVDRAGVAKLTDMGLVKDVDGDTNLTKTGRGLGTPHYMAPEQFRNAKGVDARGDVYSLGATLYCMVTGHIPFAHSNPLDCWMKKIRNEFPPPRELNPAVSERVDWAIRRAMSADPANRPASCREFFEDLTGQSRGSGPVKARTTPAADTWYMVYRDENNQPHTVKGTTQSIRDALRDNLLGDPAAILVGRSKAGQFVPLGSAPEFRDLVVAPAALGPDGKPSGVIPRRQAPIPTPRPDTTGDVVEVGKQPSGRYPRPPAPASGRYVPSPT